jgi:hypothetical protein
VDIWHRQATSFLGNLEETQEFPVDDTMRELEKTGRLPTLPLIIGLPVTHATQGWGCVDETLDQLSRLHIKRGHTSSSRCIEGMYQTGSSGQLVNVLAEREQHLLD